MANVTVTCRNFPAAYVTANSIHTRDVSLRAVLCAVVTVGAQRFPDVFSLGWRGFFHRIGMGISALSFLEQSPAGLCLSDRYHSLDMSEKGAATYWYGMALAKIVADVELGVPWLVHVDHMRESGALEIASGTNERGDLVGRDSNNDWHVVEAKGRSNSYPESLVTKAKGQSANVTKINGRPPATTSACITSLFERPISVLLDDPSTKDEDNGEHWQIAEEDFFRQYYRGIINYLDEFGPPYKKSVGNAVFLTAPLFPYFIYYPPPRRFHYEWRLELGLLGRIYEAPERALDSVRELSHDKEGRVASDGIAIFGRMPEW